MEWPAIISLYLAAFALIELIGYYRTLPYYSRKEQLRSGATFDEQWKWRRIQGQDVMRVALLIWIAITLVFGFTGLILPFSETFERPKLVSVAHIKNQSKTIVLADGNLFKLEYATSFHLKNKHPGMFLVQPRNLFGMKFGEIQLRINEYVEEFDEFINVGVNGVGKTAVEKAEKDGP